MKRNWILSGAVAAMLASATSAALAQDATPAPPPPDSTAPMAAPMDMPAPPPPAPTDAPMPMSNPGSLSSGSMMAPGSIDYSILGDPQYNYSDLKKAKAEGFSDNEVASMVRIANDSGIPFETITEEVLHGITFPTLATRYRLNLASVLDVADTKNKIAEYETAYEATGAMALKNGSMNMSQPTMTMPSSKPMTMGTDTSMSMPMTPTKDIVAIAMSDKRFSTLVKELKKADLVSALQGPGPFTVFAPTNAAFKKLPKGTLKSLEKDPAKLAAVLKYHVLPARVDAATAMSMTSPTSPPTLEGGTLQVTSSNGTVKVNDATVVQADIIASNGIIHAIDTVLMPADVTSGSMDSTMTPAPTTDTAPPPAPAPDAGSALPVTPPDQNATPPGVMPGTATPAPAPTPVQ